MKFGFQTPEGFIYNRVIGSREYNLSATLGDATILLKNDAGVLFDGQPAVARGDEVAPPPTTVPAGTAAYGLVLPVPMPFCQPVPKGPAGFIPVKLKQWKQIYYDPSLQVLFSAPVTPDTPSSSRAWVTPVIVVLVIVALVIIVLIVVFFVPPVRNVVMPYNKDKVHAQRIQEHQHFNNVEEAKSSAARKESTWMPSAKPS